jgi:hypothetical protein
MKKSTFKKIQKHHIFVLVIAAILAVLAILKFSNDHQLQFFILTALIALYLIWGFIYHYFDKSLKLEIILEYVLTAMLALTVLYGVLL